MALRQRNFYKKFKFIVEVDGFGDSGWTTVSALESEIAVVEHRQGGSLTPNKSPGLQSFADLTMERGATDDADLYNWFRETSNAVANSGAIEAQRDMTIVQQNRDGSEAERWRVFGAFPIKFTAGDWDNEADEVRMEAVDVAYDYFEKVA